MHYYLSFSCCSDIYDVSYGDKVSDNIQPNAFSFFS